MSSSKTPSDDSHFSSLFGSEFDVTRARSLTSTNTIKQSADCVLLWMNRDQRVQDNWAMVAGCKLAKIKKVPLKVVFGCFPTFGSMSTRQYNFMFEGLKEVEKELIDLKIPFEVVCGDPGVEVLKYAKSSNPVAVLTDFFPLRNCNEWNTAVASGLDSVSVPLIQIDAHNVVPAWLASDKQEVGARTLRPKIHKVYQKYLTRFPPIEPNPEGTKMPSPTDWQSVMKSISSEVEVTTIPDTFKPGKTAGMSVFSSFCESRLKNYADNRNDPNLHVQSDMSPYIRFGQVSFQRLALSIRDLKRHSSGTAAYIEEGVVRRELADNYCLYNDNYDNLNGAAGWARESLMLHSTDKREYIYTKTQLESAQTHDDLWNAAQIQLVEEGKMHGFLRMYWAKKILEWTPSPENALEWGLYLNDKYSFDGSCPNGYVGVGWSVMGIHDMGWKEREVFGKIRFMNYNGCKRKFKVGEFVQNYPQASVNAIAAGGEASKDPAPRKTKKQKVSK